MERLNALMHSIYGCSLDQFAQRVGQEWYKQGIKSGKRLAKGKPEFPKRLFLKSHGRPPVLDPILLVPQFVNFVNDRMREEGISLPAAVSRYCDVVVRAWKEIGGPEPRQEQLLRLYKRATKPKVVPDAPPIE